MSTAKPKIKKYDTAYDGFEIALNKYPVIKNNTTLSGPGTADALRSLASGATGKKKAVEIEKQKSDARVSELFK